MLYPVELEELPTKLGLAKPYIEQCLEHSPVPHSYDDIVFELAMDTGKKLFLLTQEGEVKGATILDIYTDIRTPVMNIYMMSHDPDYTEEDEDSLLLENLARAFGIKCILYYGRRGFAKRNTPKGWTISQVVMTKEVL